MIPRRENAIFQRRADVATRARDAKISPRILGRTKQSLHYNL